MKPKLPLNQRPEITILHLGSGLGDPDKLAKESVARMSSHRHPPTFGFGIPAASHVFRVIPLEDKRYDEALELIIGSMQKNGVHVRAGSRNHVTILHDEPFYVTREDGTRKRSSTSTIRLIEALLN